MKSQRIFAPNFQFMRICFTFIAAFLFANMIIAQPEGNKVTLNVKDAPLQDVLKEISRQSGVPVSYSVSQIPVDAKVTVNFRNRSAEQALKEICKPLKLSYRFVENQYVIKPLKEIAPPELFPEKSTTVYFTVSGYVYDKTSQEAIPGATVYTSDVRYGTTTNGYGFYSLTIPSGDYIMKCSFLGYKQDSLIVNLKQDINHTFKMNIDEIALKPIEIVDREDSNKFIVANRLGVDEPSPSKLARMPVFFSEPDVLKSLQLMPGIKNTVDGSNYYYVRGGERDQNLILLDDAPLYNPSHLFGFFSGINPETLTEIRLHKSDFPAWVGGKLSSVLELRTKEGNRNNFGMAGEWGLLTSRLSFEGPLFKKRSSFYVSARSSHIEALANVLMKNVDKFSFSDLHLKYNISLNSRNRLYYSFYGGLDRFILKNGNDRQGIQWGNFLTSLRWNRIWNDRLFSNSILYVSIYSYDLYQSYNSSTRWNSQISTAGLKNDFTFFRSHKVTHYFGYHACYHGFNPGVILTDLNSSPFNIPQIESLTTGESSFYFSTQRILSEKLFVRYGLRFSTYANYGPAEYYIFDGQHQIADTIFEGNSGRYNTYLRLDPSFTITKLFAEDQSVKFNYFRAHQYHQVLSNSVSPFTPIEVWYPSTPNVLPQAVDQAALGWYNLLRKYMMTLSVEVFAKMMHHQFDYENQASLFLNPLIERELRFGKTYAGGVEVMLRKEKGRLQGWIGYAYTKAVKIIDDVNNGNPYPAFSDRPVDVSLFLRWQPGQRWLYTLGVVYASGMPFTTPTGYYDYMGYKVPVYSQKNNSKMPDYFRTDVSAQFMLNKPHRKFKNYITFSVYNLTNHKNPAIIHFNKMIDDDGKFVVPSDYYGENQLQPSQIILLGVIPTLKYNFHF